MAIPKLCIMLILCFICVSCTFSETTDEESFDKQISMTLKTIIEDGLWYFPESGYFAEFINQNINYDYSIDESTGDVLVIATASVDQGYHAIVLTREDKIFTNEYFLWERSKDYNTLQENYNFESMGNGTVKIEKAKKPEYDVSEEDFEVAAEKILQAYRNWSFYGSDDKVTLYIRYFYKNSTETEVIKVVNDASYYIETTTIDGHQTLSVEANDMMDLVERIMSVSKQYDLQ